MRTFVRAVARKGTGDDLWDAYRNGVPLNDNEVDGISDEELEHIANFYIGSGIAYLLPYLPAKRHVNEDGEVVVRRVKDTQLGQALAGETACAHLHRLVDAHFDRIKRENGVKIERFRKYDIRRRLNSVLLGVDIRSKELGSRLTMWKHVEEPYSLAMRSAVDVFGANASATRVMEVTQRAMDSAYQATPHWDRYGNSPNSLIEQASARPLDYTYPASLSDYHRADHDLLRISNSLQSQPHEIDAARLYGASMSFQASRYDRMLESASDAARIMQSFLLPSYLESHRASVEQMTEQLIKTNPAWWESQAHLAAFNQASAFAHLTKSGGRVDYEQINAVRALSSFEIPNFESLSSYRNFLDSAGLSLPHWPRVRLLSASEKRQRFRERLKGAKESQHVRAAKSLVHKYETVFRDIIDASMASVYGEDWAESRLPICRCRSLLGKWKSRGGFVLEHADYANYRDIMTHDDHFEEVFSMGFSDAGELKDLIDKAGNLRAASHHAREFTKEDLRDLRLVWNSIERGLLALMPDHDLGY